MSLEDFDDDMETTTTAADPKDGDYLFEVVSFDYRDNGGGVFEMKSRIVTEGPFEGYENKRTFFLTKKDGDSRVANEDARKQVVAALKSLGFDVENWTRANNRPWSQEFSKAKHAAAGLRFKGTLKRAGAYVNVYIKGRDAKADGKPEKIGPKEIAEAHEANKDPWE